MTGYKITVTLERTLYIDNKSKIQDEVIDPLKALQIADNFLKSKGIKIPKLDMKDWTLVSNDIKKLEDGDTK